MLGVGLGVIGLTLSDFDALTPPEFASVYEQWEELQESIMQGEWNRARFLARFFLLPHCKDQNITLQDVQEFWWDVKEPKKSAPKPSSREAFEKAVEKFK
jgi:hypothetical protein